MKKIPFVLPLFMREALLGFHDSFVGKKSKKKKAGMTAPLYLFLMVWRERDKIGFDN